MGWYGRSSVPKGGYFQAQDGSSYPEISDGEGSRRIVTGYAEANDSQRYAAKSEQIIEFRGIPRKHNGLENRRPEKGSPEKDSPSKKTYEIPQRADLHDLIAKGKQTEIISSNFKDEGYAMDKSKENGFSPPSYYARVSTMTAVAPVPYETQNSVWNKGNSFNTSLPYLAQPGKYEQHNEKRKAILHAPSTAAHVFRKTIDGDTKEKNKGNEFSPPSYIGRNSTMSRTDPVPYEIARTEWHNGNASIASFPYPAQPRKDEYNEKNKANLYAPSSPTKVQPRKPHGFQETINHEEEAYAKERNRGNEFSPPYYSGRNSIMTRTDPVLYETPRTEWHRGSSFAHPAQPRKDEFNEKTKANPYAPSSPTKVQPSEARVLQKTIDSEEARRQYSGRAIPPVRAYEEEEEYIETIDCVEAARRYNGVLV